MTSIQSPPARRASFDCALVTQASCRATSAEIATWRKSPDPSGRIAVHPSLLRHADEQTVAGVAAVFKAILGVGLDPEDFRHWAVLAAPRYFGRAAFERAFPTFQAEGAWGVSPHLIPAHSLHSPSGTLSQALKAQGPNLGIGGTPASVRESLLVASTWLMTGTVEGVWVVMTGRDLESDGREPAGAYEALALALTPALAGHVGPRLRVSPDEVAPLGLADAAGLDLARWLAPGTLRADAPIPSGAIPSPHFRAGRPAREIDRNRDPEAHDEG